MDDSGIVEIRNSKSAIRNLRTRAALARGLYQRHGLLDL